MHRPAASFAEDRNRRSGDSRAFQMVRGKDVLDPAVPGESRSEGDWQASMTPDAWAKRTLSRLLDDSSQLGPQAGPGRRACTTRNWTLPPAWSVLAPLSGGAEAGRHHPDRGGSFSLGGARRRSSSAAGIRASRAPTICCRQAKAAPWRTRQNADPIPSASWQYMLPITPPADCNNAPRGFAHCGMSSPLTQSSTVASKRATHVPDRVGRRGLSGLQRS